MGVCPMCSFNHSLLMHQKERAEPCLSQTLFKNLLVHRTEGPAERLWYDWIKSQHWLWPASTCRSSDFLHWRDCALVQIGPIVWLRLCDGTLFVNLLSFLHSFFHFFFSCYQWQLLWIALDLWPPFSSDSLAFEKMAVCVLTCCSCCWCESKLLQNSWHSQVHWLLWLVSVSIPFSVTGGEGRQIYILFNGGLYVETWENQNTRIHDTILKIDSNGSGISVTELGLVLNLDDRGMLLNTTYFY